MCNATMYQHFYNDINILCTFVKIKKYFKRNTINEYYLFQRVEMESI